uniref:NADH-ubiquinone oxidoreductase chain 3 n=1 Tax=Melanotrichia acclivopennis TaxID=2904888 RepID=A0A9E8RT20_9NEOP|nr:NADH dehydrogenase subunit 3 [Melanotrichia acclivopennis]UZZ44149.1 NADH dehydrogenase subunit 3 [Melanotrichia acclivopennis]
MMNMMMMFSLFMLLSIIMITISFIISKKKFLMTEKNSSFECGFNPLSSPRTPFSMHFFLITVLFLIFDIEISIIIPFIIIINYSMSMNFYLLFNLFMLILILGLFHEWKQNILNWKI